MEVTIQNLPMRHHRPGVPLCPVLLELADPGARVETHLRSGVSQSREIVPRVVQQPQQRFTLVRVEVEASDEQWPQEPGVSGADEESHQFIVGPSSKSSSRASSNIADAQETTRSSAWSSSRTSRISAMRMACR